MRVIGYVRVSTEEQAADGVSLAAQEQKVRLYAALHGLDLAEVIVDPGASAKTLDRPGVARALGMLARREADGLVVYKLDRLTRSLADWSSLIEDYFGERPGRSLMSVSESIDTRTAAGRMVLNIMMTVYQWERETIAERTQAAMNYKRARGERISGPIPYGSALSEDGSTLRDDPAERAVIATILGRRALGASPRAIAALLNARSIRAKGGGRWNESSVRSILKRHPPLDPSDAA